MLPPADISGHTREIMSRPARDCRVDNIRAVLIFLVVVGHLIPFCAKNDRGFLYNLIFSFHMPAFVFLNGLYARYNGRKLLKRFIIPYIVFELLFYYFQTYLLHEGFTLQLTTPYYTLWYLMTIASYYCLTELIQTKSRDKAIKAVGCAFLLSLLVGFDDSVGTYLSLSRTIAFLPFFLLGYYHSLLFTPKTVEEFHTPHVLTCIIIIMLALEFVLNTLHFPFTALLYCYSYFSSGSILIRMLSEASGLCWIYILFRFIPNKKIWFLTDLGQNTMPVYLLHGFIVKTIWHFKVLHYDTFLNNMLAIAIAVPIVFLLGNKYTYKALQKLFY